MRLFVALKTNLNKEKVFSYEKSLMHIIPNVKWTEKKNLHLTLKFLGETSDDALKKVISLLSDAVKTFSSFDFEYEGMGAFPSLFKARVLFVSVSGGEKIVVLMKEIDDSFVKLGFKKERNYVPHLTLGRVKKGAVNLKHFNIPDFKNEKVNASGIMLMKSTLTGNGPIYECIEEFDFT